MSSYQVEGSGPYTQLEAYPRVEAYPFEGQQQPQQQQGAPLTERMTLLKPAQERQGNIRNNDDCCELALQIACCCCLIFLSN